MYKREQKMSTILFRMMVGDVAWENMIDELKIQ